MYMYMYISDEHRVPRDVSTEGPFPYIVTHKEGQVRVPCKMSLALLKPLYLIILISSLSKRTYV